MQEFSSRLKKIRKSRKLSQKDLAEDLGYARTTIANYEQNTRIPSLETILEIADYFNISLDYLLGRTKIKNTFQDLILDKIQTPVLLIEPESAKIIDFNKAALNYYNYTKSELNYKSIFEINKSSKEIINNKIKKALNNESYPSNFIHKLGNEELRNVIVFYQAVNINGKSIIHSTIFDFDASPNIISNLNQVAKIFQQIFESKFTFLDEHHNNVRKVSSLICNQLDINNKKTNLIEQSARIHDIGSLLLPTELLYKANLSKSEYKIIKEHPTYGYELFNTLNEDIAQIIRDHHEKIDGSGYPNQLKDEEIRFEAKILSVAEVFATMNNRRPYREKPGFEKACLELKENRGIKYDAKIADACLEIAKSDKFNFLIED
ncbi:MAG: HD domain-containing phosphohydrolase [Halanaerobium sp.]